MKPNTFFFFFPLLFLLFNNCLLSFMSLVVCYALKNKSGCNKRGPYFNVFK